MEISRKQKRVGLWLIDWLTLGWEFGKKPSLKGEQIWIESDIPYDYDELEQEFLFFRELLLAYL